MPDTDIKHHARISAAIRRIRSWRDEDYDDLPSGYTHETPEFDRDLDLVCDFASTALVVVANAAAVLRRESF